MAKIIGLPDGSEAEFPDGMSDAEITGVLSKQFPKPEAPSRLNQAMQSFSPKGVFDSVRATGEVAAQMGTGVLGQVAGGLHGLGTLATGGGIEKAAENTRNTQDALTYQPRSTLGKGTSAAIAAPFEAANEKLGDAGEFVGGNAGRAIGEAALPVAMTLLPAKGILRQGRALSEKLNAPKPLTAEDIQFAKTNAARINASEVAQKYQIGVNPVSVNPSVSNRFLVGAAGEDMLNAKLSLANEGKWNKIVRDDMGIAKDAPLDATTLKVVRDRAAVPMDEISKLGTFLPDEGTINAINGLRQKSVIGGQRAAGEVGSLVDDALSRLNNGMDAGELLNNISALRKNARDIFKKSDAGPEQLAVAETNIKIANQLEGMIDTNLYGMAERNPHGGFAELGDAYRKGRQQMAKSYVIEDNLDLNTGKINPAGIAKLGKTDNAMTGGFADIAEIAGNFPQSSRIGVITPHDISGTHLMRSGPAGAVGSIIGGSVAPVLGHWGGGMLGAAVGEAFGRGVANRLTLPEVQALRSRSRVPSSIRNAFDDLPDEARMADAPPKKGPIEYERSPSAAYDAARLAAPDEGPTVVPPRGDIPNAPQPYQHPNWQYGDNSSPPPAPPPQQPSGAPALRAPADTDVMNRVDQQRSHGYRMEQSADNTAQATAEAQAAALRQPASGGQVLNFDEVTNRLTPDNGIKGATPETIQSTGHSLQSAAEKLAAGRAFDMTAAEKVAWNHTKTSLTEGIPQLKGLSEREIFNRISDRQWVAETVKKLREKDIAFEGIRRSAAEEQAIQSARMNREMMADHLEALEEQFHKPQNVKVGQGAKTRDFIRSQVDALRMKKGN